MPCGLYVFHLHGTHPDVSRYAVPYHQYRDLGPWLSLDLSRKRVDCSYETPLTETSHISLLQHGIVPLERGIHFHMTGWSPLRSTVTPVGTRLFDRGEHHIALFSGSRRFPRQNDRLFGRQEHTWDEIQLGPHPGTIDRQDAIARTEAAAPAWLRLPINATCWSRIRTRQTAKEYQDT
jgi:hypothetical protein